MVRAALPAFLLLAACAGEDGGTTSIYDGRFFDPDDFPRDLCEAGSLAGLAPSGIWHAFVELPGEWYPRAFRLDGDGARPAATLNGRPAQAMFSFDDLIVRSEWVDGNGRPRLLALDGCGRGGGGEVVGGAIFCAEEDCYTGVFRGTEVGRLPGEAESAGVEVLATWNGGDAPWAGEDRTYDVVVRDEVAYVVRGDGLVLVDVSNPAAPRDLGRSPVSDPELEYYNDVAIVDAGARRFALIASMGRGVVVVDVTDPGAPFETGDTFPPVPDGESEIRIHTISVEGTRAYLANYDSDGMDIYDVADPTAPRRLAAYVDPATDVDNFAFVHDMYVEPGRAYVNYWSQGLVVVDTTDPENPTRIGNFADYDWRTSHASWVTEVAGRKVALIGDEMYFAHLRVIDVDEASPEFLTEIGSFSLRDEVSIHNIVAVGDRAYVAHYQDGFRLLDISEPTTPAMIGYANTWDPATALGESFYDGALGVDVDVARGLVFVADAVRGLVIVRPFGS
jgi:hypothetical protein